MHPFFVILPAVPDRHEGKGRNAKDKSRFLPAARLGGPDGARYPLPHAFANLQDCRMIRAWFILLACQLLGEALRMVTGAPLPGPVIGMLLLAGALLVMRRGKVYDAEGDLDRLSGQLIRHMGLLFVPAGVGIIAQADLLQAQWLPITAALVGSTVLGLLVTALVMRWTLRAQS